MAEEQKNKEPLKVYISKFTPQNFADRGKG